MKFELFQTLDTRYEIDETENQGPIKCENPKNAWLGFGYYFWEDDINLAHGWGARHYNGEFYCICKTTIIYNDQKCLDLVHVPSHKRKFREVCLEIKNKNDYDSYEQILIAEVFDYLNIYNRPWMSNFEAVRVYGEGSFKDFVNQIKFDDAESRDRARLTLNPEIQWCLFKKNSMGRTGFTLVFPDESEYVCKERNGGGFY